MRRSWIQFCCCAEATSWKNSPELSQHLPEKTSKSTVMMTFSQRIKDIWWYIYIYNQYKFYAFWNHQPVTAGFFQTFPADIQMAILRLQQLPEFIRVVLHLPLDGGHCFVGLCSDAKVAKGGAGSFKCSELLSKSKVLTGCLSITIMWYQ